MEQDPDKAREPSRLRELLAYFLRLGTLGFGGPIALAGYMERDLVEERGWISKTDYLQGLTLAQLAPGPLAAQLAIYLGYAHSGVLGATLVGAAFILPSFLMVVAIAAAYSRFGGLAWVQAVFYGIGAAVMAIIARSAYKLTRSTVARKRLLWLIYAAMAVTTAATRRENPWLFLASGLLSLMVYAPPFKLGGGILPAVLPWVGLWSPQGRPPADSATLKSILLFFLKAGAFVFGSGLAIGPLPGLRLPKRPRPRLGPIE